MKGLAKTALATAVLAGIAIAAQASAAGTVSANPYSPANGHPYRHGVIPTLNVHAAMVRWAHAHAQVANSPTLSSGGGTSGVEVMNGQNKVYIVFWGTQWGTSSTDSNGNLKFSGDSAGAAGAAQQMFKGIGTNNETWQNDLTQWCNDMASGATSCSSSDTTHVPRQGPNILAGVWYDNSAEPSAATAAQLGAEANKAAAHFGNTTAASNRFTYYIVASAPTLNPDNYQGQYCAWHDYTADSGAPATYGQLAFSNQPYNIDSGAGCGVGFVNSPGTLDGWTMTLGHEWHEMMSDTYPAGGMSNHNTGTYAGQENSDECAWIAAGSAGGAANIAFSTGTFTEQASWSNDTNNCAISHADVSGGGGGTTPTANFSDSISGLTVTFTDSSSDVGGTITGHSWTFGDGGTSTATSPSHTYAAAGTYSVTETVTDSGGKTASKTVSVTVSSGGTGGTPTANFTDTVSGLTANFTDTSTDSGGTIGSHSWTFGDGGTSTATSPSHTYTAAGTYSVTETVTDSVNGHTSSKTASVTVSGGGGSVQLLGNTGFESTASWTASAGVMCNTGCSGESAHGGVGFAWLDGYGSSHTDTLSQTVTVPSGHASGTLQYYLHIDTAETTTTTAYDKLTVALYSGSTLVRTIATYSNLNKNTGYTVHSNALTSSDLSHSSLTLKFTGTEDVSLQTSFVLDDVTLTAN